MVKKVISFILTIVMAMSLCSPGFVTSYATQDTETGTETETQTETAELTETVTRMPRANNPSRYWCMAEAEDGTHILIDNSNIDRFELIR